ncbi:MAG: hypothetical protein ACLPSF_02755 [Methylocella sp.]
MKHVYTLSDAGLDPLAPTIYHEQWWLDIATGGCYDRVEIVSNGKCVGWLPYFMRNKFGFNYSIPPRMTHVLGPAIDAGVGSADARAYSRACITHELIAKLPPAAI